MQNNILLILFFVIIFILLIIILMLRKEVNDLKTRNSIIDSDRSNLSKHNEQLQLENNHLQFMFEKAQKETSTYRLIHEKREMSLQKILEGHKKAFPYLASIMADYSTLDIKLLAEQLNWGHNIAREKKLLQSIIFVPVPMNVLPRRKLQLIS